MKIKHSKKGLELVFSQVVWFIILGILLLVVAAWYLGLRDKIVMFLSNIFG